MKLLLLSAIICMQVWLLGGVIFILHFEYQWYIPLAATFGLALVVMIAPLIWDFVLNEKQRASISRTFSRKKKEADSY